MSISKRVKTQRVQYKESTDDYFVVDQTTKEIIYGPGYKQDCEDWVEANPDLAVNVVVLQGEEDNGVLVTEAAGGFDEQFLRDTMDLLSEEIATEYDIDLNETLDLTKQVLSGKYLFGSSPTVYCAKNGYVFEGEFTACETSAKLASVILVMAAESGLSSLQLVDSKDKFSPDEWDVEAVNLLENVMKKRKISRLEAFKLTRKLKESKKSARLLREDELEAGDNDQVFIVVSLASDDAEVKFTDGNLLVGPFSSEEEAQDAAGEDVITVTGGEVSSNANPAPETNEPELKEGKRFMSNFLRTRRQVAESTRRQVLARIKRESEALASTDAKNDDKSTDDAAGALDMAGVASFVNNHDNGPNELDSLASDSDPAAKSSDKNMLEAVARTTQVGALVDVFDLTSKKKVDTGIVGSIAGGKVVLEGGEVYAPGKYGFKQTLV